MNNLPHGDYNMPPGVRASDIPGNRPEDDVEIVECKECGEEYDAQQHDKCPHCGKEL